METETFERVKPQKDDYCKIVYLYKGRKFETTIFYEGIFENKLMLRERNWANDSMVLEMKNLLFISKV